MSNTHESTQTDHELEAFIRQRCTVADSCLQYSGPEKVLFREKKTPVVLAYRSLLRMPNLQSGERLHKTCNTPGCIDVDCWQVVRSLSREDKSAQNAHNTRVAIEAAIRRLEEDAVAITACTDKLTAMIKAHEDKRMILVDRLTELVSGL